MIVEEESLPKPYVHYADTYGTFLGFSDTEASDVYFCTCCKSSIENFLELKKQMEESTYSDPLRDTILDNLNFPNSIAELSAYNSLDSAEQLLFADELCHRCLQKTPQKRYCAPMYGGTFKQAYGWYIQQNFLRVGIKPGNIGNYLKDVCPQKIQLLLTKCSNIQAQIELQKLRVFPDANGIQLGEIDRNEWQVERQLDKELSKNRRQVTKIIENLTREEFGFRKIGEQWVSETLLYQLIVQLYPNQEIIRNIRPKWLEGLELDIYLPQLNLAFEYQGQQHYKPIKAWGGDKAFKALKRRDARKKELCRQLGIRLIEFKYSEDLSLSTLKQKFSLV